MKRTFETKPPFFYIYEDEAGEMQEVTADLRNCVFSVFNDEGKRITDKLDQSTLRHIRDEYDLYIEVARQFYAQN